MSSKYESKKMVYGMLEKYNEFVAKKKSIQDRKSKLKKQIGDLNKEKLRLKVRELQKSLYNRFTNGPSGFAKY